MKMRSAKFAPRCGERVILKSKLLKLLVHNGDHLVGIRFWTLPPLPCGVSTLMINIFSLLDFDGPP